MTAVFYAQRFDDASLRLLIYNLAFGLLSDEDYYLLDILYARRRRRNRYENMVCGIVDVPYPLSWSHAGARVSPLLLTRV